MQEASVSDIYRGFFYIVHSTESNVLFLLQRAFLYAGPSRRN